MFQIKQIYIKNFRSIEEDTIIFWANKNVIVWKNWSWKTNILKALEKLLHSKKIKEKDFKKSNKEIILKAIISYKNTDFKINLESKLIDWKIITKLSKNTEKENQLIKKINVIYIPSDRKISNKNKENWYVKLIDLILKNKEEDKKLKISNLKKNIKKIDWKSWKKKTTLLISLLRLYIYSINETNNSDFKIFIIDQPENFLHPHATKMIDSIIQKIWELENTQIFYSTHSPELVSNFKKWKYEISDIIFVKNEKNQTITKKINNAYWRFNKIMINLIFKNASIFFSDKVILVEWETEKISIPNIYENIKWWKYIKNKNLTKEDRENFFNLNYKNISIIDVWWKWALYEWFIFASELFWKENVVALIDKDENYELDYEMITKSIKKVYKVDKVYESNFKKYNWIVLDWEFENYYKIELIKEFISKKIKERLERDNWTFSEEKYEKALKKLDYKLSLLKESKKISSTYEYIFNWYFRKYSKPTIAFNLSIWLSQNDWYKEELLKIFANIIKKFSK